MREIKFRAKRIDNGEWIYGYYVEGDEDGHGRHYIATNGIHGVMIQIDPETLGQYTGGKDKNGVEIYEGDIVRWPKGAIVYSPGHEEHPYHQSVVTWCEKHMAYTPNLHCPEVIGNVHENSDPEK